MNKSIQNLLSYVPQVNQILSHPKLQLFIDKFSHDLVVASIQQQTEKLREQIVKNPNSLEISKQVLLETIAEKSVRQLEEKLKLSLRKAINATGIILHTGLGRAPLSEEARNNLKMITEGYCTLEIDLETGKRGERTKHVEELVCQLTGAEAACVVNNNAAAVLLTLNTICFGKEAIISRGQLIEIGGSFRIPEVMAKSGATMVEVGTTNKTHLRDYENAISENTGLIFAVHPSNYRIKGFTAEVELQKLVSLGKNNSIPVAQDLGGGVLVDLRKYNLPYEPVARESVDAGVDIITFSGDKVLGGPQSGIIIGKKSYVDAIKSNPLMRALRCDKLIYATLEPTLKLYLQEKDLVNKNRVLNMLLEPLESLEKRADNIKSRLTTVDKSNVYIRIENTTVQTGSGTLPLEELPSKAITLQVIDTPTENLAKRFRMHEPPIIGYIRDDKLYLDIRTIFQEEEDVLIHAIRKVISGIS